MTSYRKQHAARRRLRFSSMGKASQRAQAARRIERMPERMAELAEIEAQNLPRKQGDALGCFHGETVIDTLLYLTTWLIGC